MSKNKNERTIKLTAHPSDLFKNLLDFFSGKLNLFKNVFAIAAPGTNIRDSIKRLVSIYQNVGRPASAKPVSICFTDFVFSNKPEWNKEIAVFSQV